MTIDTRNPLSPGMLAALYSGNPREADSQMFLGSAQSHSWVQDQARNMGISDPVAHFAALQNQQQTNSAPLLSTQLAMRAAGQYAPNTLPGQLAARDSMWDQSAAAQQAQQTQLATLQRNRALGNPMPTFDMPSDPNSTLEQSGMSPATRAFTQRLGGVSEGRQFIGDNQSALDPDTLTTNPRFSALLQQSPDKAAQVFAALTGGNLGTHLKTQVARNVDQDKFGLNTMQEWAKGGRAHFDTASNSWKMRQLVPDPNDPSGQRLVVGGNYEEPDPFQAGILRKYGPQVAPGMQEEITRLNHYKATEAAAMATGQATGQRVQVGQNQGTPAIFQSPAFARLQKTNPARAQEMWLEFQRQQQAPAFQTTPSIPLLPGAMNRYTLNPDPSYNTRR